MAKRTSAFDRALREAQGATVEQSTPQDSANAITVAPAAQENRSTVAQSTLQNGIEVTQSEPLNRQTVAQSHRETVRLDKITFYLTAEQIKKLDQLEIEYRMNTGRRINRNDLVRHLIEQCSITSFDDM
jgi:hypothetical protein